MFCVSYGGDRDFRDRTEIRGIRKKIDKGVGKTGGISVSAGNSG
jgi:hypothetical protein